VGVPTEQQTEIGMSSLLPPSFAAHHRMKEAPLVQRLKVGTGTVNARRQSRPSPIPLAGHATLRWDKGRFGLGDRRSLAATGGEALWKRFIYFHLLLDRLTEAGHLPARLPRCAGTCGSSASLKVRSWAVIADAMIVREAAELLRRMFG
jgi:hypothetical protein